MVVELGVVLLALAGGLALHQWARARARGGASAGSADARARRAIELMAVAEAHWTASEESELEFDRRRARELAERAVELLDEACDRVPDRARDPEWQARRVEARRLLARIEDADG